VYPKSNLEMSNGRNDENHIGKRKKALQLLPLEMA